MPTSNFLLQNTPFYPFRFEPLYKNYLWGGTRFRDLFRRYSPEVDGPHAESWEIADHPDGHSAVQNGPLSGRLLNDLVRARPLEMFGAGRFDPEAPPERFPLILKYLDAEQTLSVQVHPDDRLAREMALGDSGKTEVWIVVDARPGSSLWLGTKQDCSKDEVRRAIDQGELESVLNRVEARVGDCFYLKPGTLHALGEGILVAEVQTSSNTTFRVFDWNRLDTDGAPRELKIDEALRALDEISTPVAPQVPAKSAFSDCEQLIADEHFTINRWTLSRPLTWQTDDRCHLWSVLEGSADAIFKVGRRSVPKAVSGRENDPDAIETFNLGDSLLVPAACLDIRWIPENNRRVVLLDVIIEKC